MRNVLIVSPNFAPSSTPDQHRVRVALPYLESFGWHASVISVQPRFVEAATDNELIETIPPETPVFRIKALDQRLTRQVGLGNLGLRALPFLLTEALPVLRRNPPDLIYISTTMFPAMAAARLWKRWFGVPYVLDIQDPWLSTYQAPKPNRDRPPKHWFSQIVNTLLEPWTMRKVAGITAVSRAYIDTLQERYPWLSESRCLTLPFAGSERDFEVAYKNGRQPRSNDTRDGNISGIYVGRAGPDMEKALSIIFAALKLGLQRAPTAFRDIRLRFIGTDYAPAPFARPWVLPIAERLGVEDHVSEQPERMPYFEALRTISGADFLLVPGSDDPQYTASKIFPYILARKPLLAVFHEQSSVVGILRQAGAGEVVTFTSKTDVETAAEDLSACWEELLNKLPFTPATDWGAFEPFTAREMTRKLCAFFDRILELEEGAKAD